MRLAPALALLTLLPGALFAQPGRIAGTVTNELGVSLAWTSVLLIRDGRMVKNAIADSTGRFEADSLEFGSYDVVVRRPGSVAQRLTNIPVRSHIVPDLRLQMPTMTATLDAIVVSTTCGTTAIPLPSIRPTRLPER